jgi:hypothetical protein
MAQVIGSDVKTFRASLSATVMAPGDAGHEEARSIWNGNIGRRPGLIARYSSPAEEVPSGSRGCRAQRIVRRGTATAH